MKMLAIGGNYGLRGLIIFEGGLSQAAVEYVYM